MCAVTHHNYQRVSVSGLLLQPSASCGQERLKTPQEFPMSESQDSERIRNDQRDFWNSAAPGWKQLFVELDHAAQHVSDRLIELARIKDGDRILDIATGSGEPAVTAARKVGARGLVVATDQSSAMLAMARERAATLGLANVRFVETDAETLAVEERSFNAALCRWGLMFVPDLDAAARRIAALLVARGGFATTVWGPAERVPMISLGEDAVRELANLPPMAPVAPHPLRLADTRPVEQALENAGFKDIHVEPIIVRFQWESAEAFTEQRRAMSAPFRAVLSKQPFELQQRILAAVTAAAGKYSDSSGIVCMDNEAICIAAHL
jgi:ubiquinone/menaquinone biosynthesis C-methylase UbiE